MTDHLYPPPTTTIAAASSSPGERFQCSFCKADDGRHLVRGAVGVFICCECVVLAGNLFEEDEMDRRAPVPHWTAGHQVGCLLPDGHEGPCVEAVWKEEAGPARPMKQIWGATAGDWRLDARGDGRWWVRGPYGTMTMSAERAPLSPDAEEARRRAEDCLRKLLTVPGITLTVR